MLARIIAVLSQESHPLLSDIIVGSYMVPLICNVRHSLLIKSNNLELCVSDIVSCIRKPPFKISLF